MEDLEAAAIIKIDSLLAKYYTVMGRNDYFNDDGNGKFKAFCDNNTEHMDFLAQTLKNTEIKGDEELLMLEDENEDENEDEYEDADDWFAFDAECDISAIDTNFPGLPVGDNQQEIFKILRYFYHQYDKSTEQIKQNLSWINILNIVKFEFDDNTCKSLRKIMNNTDIDENDTPEQKEVEQTLKQLWETKTNLPQDQLKWLLYVFHKFNASKIEGTQSLASSIDMVHDVYKVHKIFMNDMNKTSDYSLNEFCEESKINEEMQDELIVKNLLNPPLNLPPYYIINDDIQLITNYLFGITYLINDKASNSIN
eukprot:6238_1